MTINLQCNHCTAAIPSDIVTSGGWVECPECGFELDVMTLNMAPTRCQRCSDLAPGLFCISHTCPDCMHRHDPDQPCHDTSRSTTLCRDCKKD